MNLLATIPFPCGSFSEAEALVHAFNCDGIVVETRGDRLQIVQALPEDFEDNKWYVVIHTGNLLGMIYDLQESGFF